MSQPKVIGRHLKLVVLSPPIIPAFLAELKGATSIIKNPFDSFKFKAFAISKLTSVPEALNHGCS